MIVVNHHKPLLLKESVFDVRLDRTTEPLPPEVQQRVDTLFNEFADKAEKKSGKRPTKGEVCVLSDFAVLPRGLVGACKSATFDEVLYFARSQISEGDYAIGRERGFPLASWAVLSSTDNRLLFLRKKGVEGAYEGSPFSAFGSLVSVEKDVEDGRVSPRKLLERSVGGEVGKAVWERVSETANLGLNVYDENSSKVNNGYDIVLKVGVDAKMNQVISLLEENRQFEPNSHIEISVEPNALREFISTQPTTVSGLSGVLNYIGSMYGEDEVRKQYELYREARGKDVRDVKLVRVRE